MTAPLAGVELTVDELAARIAKPIVTTQSLLDELEAVDLVESHEGRYRLTPAADARFGHALRDVRLA